MVTLLFDLKRDQFENSNMADFDFSLFGTMNTTTGAELMYFSRSVKAEKDILAVSGQAVTDCNTELIFDSVVIDNDTAVVNVYEWLSYYYCTDEGEKADFISGHGIDYEIEFEKGSEGWEVVGIDFYNEVTEILRDNNVSVSAFVQSINAPAPSSVLAQSAEAQAFGVAAPAEDDAEQYVQFSGYLSASYAYTYGGSNRHPRFYDFSNSGGDCQNFASQCIWAGLRGQNSSIATCGLPMIDEMTADLSDRAWYVTPTGAHSNSWTVVSSFYNYVNNGGSYILGLCGTIYSGVAYAEPGDVIQIRDNSGYYHSYVVTRVTGEAGSRDRTDIYISSHTTDRLDEQLGVASSNCRTIAVDGAWVPAY